MVASSASSPEVRGDFSPGQPAAQSLSGITVWGATDAGRERSEDEDAVYPDLSGSSRYFRPTAAEIERKGQLLLVADGVGADGVGSTASQWTIRLVAERYYALSGEDSTWDLRDAFEYSNESLYRYLRSAGAVQAGSTLAAAVIRDGILYAANVGNSRVYLMRNGTLYQQSRDHTLAQRKVEQGKLTQAEATVDPGNSVLTRALGAAAAVTVDVFRPMPLADGDTVVLCSDGLYKMVSDAEIARIVRGFAPRRAVERLIEAANAQGGYDNISVIVAQVGAVAVQTKEVAGYLATLREDLASLDVAQKRLLWILFWVAAAVLVTAMFALGWSLHSPKLPTASMVESAAMAFLSAVWRGGHG